jgi:hypothetical protein
MRDMLDDLFGNEPIDPVESARRNTRPKLRKPLRPNGTSKASASIPPRCR